MVPRLTDYIDWAMQRQGFRFYSELSRRLGLTRPQANGYKNEKSVPSDDTMVLLAELAGKDPIDALIHLNMWRAKGIAKKYYSEMVSRLGAVLIFAAVLLPSQADAFADQTRNRTQPNTPIYTLCDFVRRLIRRYRLGIYT